MSLTRMTAGVFAGLLRSIVWAVGTMRRAPPVPVASAWQPEPAQLLVPLPPIAASCVTKIGLMQRWKYAYESRWPTTTCGFVIDAGLPSGLEPEPPQDARTQSAA